MPTGTGPTTADRVRYLLSSYFSLALAACVLLAAGGLVVAVGAHTGPDTTTEQRVVATWATEGGFDHAAVVQRDVRAFDQGEAVRNRSTYFASVMPVLNGTYVYEYGGDAESVSVTTDLGLVVRSVDPAGEREVLWRETSSVSTVETSSLGPDETHRVPFAVNVSRRVAFGRAVQEDLGSNRGRVEVLVVAETVARTTLDGETLVDRRTDRLRAVSEGATYAVAANVSGEHRRQVSRSVDVPTESNPVGEYGSLVAALVGLAGGGGLLWVRREGRLTPAPETQEGIRLRRERDSFAEWISVGRVPPGDERERTVVVDTLPDLVDVAIDSERRVIEDADSGVFVVLDGRTRYEYWPQRAAGPTVHAGGSSESGDEVVERAASDATDGWTEPERTADEREGTGDERDEE